MDVQAATGFGLRSMTLHVATEDLVQAYACANKVNVLRLVMYM